MAYEPTADDLNALQASQGAYQPTADDLNALRSSNNQAFQPGNDDSSQIALVPPGHPILSAATSAAEGMLQGASSFGQGIAKNILDPIAGTHSPSVTFNESPEAKSNPGLFLAGDILGNVSSTGGLYDAALAGLTPMQRILGSGLVSGGLSDVQSDQKNNIESTALGTGLGIAGRAIGEGIQGGLSAINDFIKSPAAIKATQEAMNQPGYNPIEMPIGNVVGSPSFNKLYENILSNLPGSGVNASVAKMQSDLNTRAGQVISDMAPEMDKQITGVEGQKLLNYPSIFDTVASGFKAGFKNLKNTSAALYSDAAEAAEKAGIKVNPDTFKQTAQNMLDQNAQLAKEFPLASYPSEITSLLQKAAGSAPIEDGGIISPITGRSVETPTQTGFTSTTKAIQALNAVSRDAIASGNAQLSRIVGNLNNALRSDFDNATNEYGQSPDKNVSDAIDKWKTAQSFYKNVISPYEDVDFNKSGQEFVGDLIKKGALVNPIIARSFVGAMPEEASNIPMIKDGESLKELPGMAYLLANAPVDEMGNVQPTSASIVKAYQGLKSPITRQTLFPNSKQSLDNLTDLHTSSANTINNVLNNAPTGKTLGTALGLGGGIIGPAATGGYFGYKNGGVPGAIAGGFGLAAGATLAGRGGAAMLENPAFQNFLITNMGIVPRGLSSAISQGAESIPALSSAIQNQNGVQQ